MIGNVLPAARSRIATQQETAPVDQPAGEAEDRVQAPGQFPIATEQADEAGQVGTGPIAPLIRLHGTQDAAEDQAAIKPRVANHQVGLQARRGDGAQFVRAQRIGDD